MGQIRDAARTRMKIMEAARDEFAERGFSGARMESIARRAGLAKQLLYHYVPSKEALFEEVVEHKFSHHRPPAGDASGPGGLFRQRFLGAASDPVGVRFMTWEAAEQGAPGEMSAETARRESAARQLAQVRARQAAGDLPGDLPAELLQLAINALGIYPLAYARSTRLITGQDADDPDFQAAWLAFLDELAARLARR